MYTYILTTQSSFKYEIAIDSSLYYTDVPVSTIDVITPGENFISPEWSPSEGSPLSYTVTWTRAVGPLLLFCTLLLLVTTPLEVWTQTLPPQAL